MANFLKSLFVKGVEIDTASATAGKVLTYDGTKFAPATPGTGSLGLNDLSDVVVTTPATTQYVRYNGTNWVNQTISAGDVPTLNQNTTGTAATVTGASQTAITSVGTLTGLTIGGAGANRSITINAPTGYYAIQYFAINGTNEWHYEVNPAGTRWSLVESGVAERIGVTNAGATFSGTVTATTFSGSGALTSLTIDGPLSPSVFFGDWNQNNEWSGIRGTHGYLLTGNSAGATGVYLRSESASHSVHIGSNNTNTLIVTNTSATVAGTMNATTFSGSGSSLTSLPAGQLTGTIANARLPTAINISSTMQAYSYQGNANVAGTGNASYHPSGIYSTGSNWLYGTMFLNGNNIGDTSSTVTGAGQIYANGWFRSWGDTGWYNQSYGGGMYMVDTTFVRVYNSKAFFASGGIFSVDTATASTSGYQYLLRGTVYGNYAPFSSMREAKRNIETISNSGLLIDQLNPVTFQEQLTDQDDEISTAWKNADLEYGFIADEVAQVGTGHLAQYKSMDDGTLKPVGWSFHGVVSVLVAEVKELRKRVTQLESTQ